MPTNSGRRLPGIAHDILGHECVLRMLAPPKALFAQLEPRRRAAFDTNEARAGDWLAMAPAALSGPVHVTTARPIHRWHRSSEESLPFLGI